MNNATYPPYDIFGVDKAGNQYHCSSFPTFEHALERLKTYNKLRPFELFFIINSDKADYDSDGLTEEEREQLPA